MLRFLAIKITTYYFVLERRLVDLVSPACPLPLAQTSSFATALCTCLHRQTLSESAKDFMFV